MLGRVRFIRVWIGLQSCWEGWRSSRARSEVPTTRGRCTNASPTHRAATGGGRSGNLSHRHPRVCGRCTRLLAARDQRDVNLQHCSLVMMSESSSGLWTWTPSHDAGGCACPMGSTPTPSPSGGHTSYSGDLASPKQHLTSPLCNSETESGVPVDPGADASGGQAARRGVFSIPRPLQDACQVPR